MGAQMIQTPSLNLTTTNPAMIGWHRESSWLADYPANEQSVVFVIGAYSGTTAGLLLDVLPQAKYHLFEPQDWAVAQLQERFGHLPNVRICAFALGDRIGTFPMALYTSNGCTFVEGSIEYSQEPQHWTNGRMEEIARWCESAGIAEIHHASLNIEGYEYILLPHMARTGWLSRCKTIGISWHGSQWNTVVPGPFTWQGDPVAEYDEVQDILARDHRLVLEIDNWQSWVRR